MVPSPAASPAGRPRPQPPDEDDSPLTLYARALQDYTLRLWTESLKAVEERRARLAQKQKPMKPMSEPKQSAGAGARPVKQRNPATTSTTHRALAAGAIFITLAVAVVHHRGYRPPHDRYRPDTLVSAPHHHTTLYYLYYFRRFAFQNAIPASINHPSGDVNEVSTFDIRSSRPGSSHPKANPRSPTHILPCTALQKKIITTEPVQTLRWVLSPPGFSPILAGFSLPPTSPSRFALSEIRALAPDFLRLRLIPQTRRKKDTASEPASRTLKYALELACFPLKAGEAMTYGRPELRGSIQNRAPRFGYPPDSSDIVTDGHVLDASQNSLTATSIAPH
ncbi:hypothetical protein C8R47DRAFT_1321017 [Mycena vitilis]|nr:hypothetical protein C8R47DRAFT_1321017 [Mycena vitilis]